MTAVAVQTRRSSEKMLVGGEFPFTQSDFEQIAALLHADSGIHLPDTKATLVYSRLAKRLRALGLTSFREYCALIDGPDGADERRRMLPALTTNVTRFFRESHHFDHLRGTVLPEVARQAVAGGRVRLWSAGCSTGMEPYSMALTLLAALPSAPDLDVKILATDIDPVVIAHAREGAYPDDIVDDIPAEMRRHVERSGDGCRMSAAVRGLISFRELNLMADWPMKGPFQAIFCRNVAIYFEEATQQRLWSRMRPLLAAEGRLYVGHSERVADTTFATDGLTTYRLAGGARA